MAKGTPNSAIKIADLLRLVNEGARKIHSPFHFRPSIINLDKVINSAVLIEKHRDKYKGTSRENENLQAVYVLFRAFRDGDYVIPVPLELKKSSDLGGSLYLTVTITKIEASVLGGTVDENQALHLIPASITYNLADVFREINHQKRKIFGQKKSRLHCCPYTQKNLL